MLTRPFGTPASCSSSPIRSAVSGVSFGGLMTTRVAGAERRCELAGDHRRREVPRGDDGHHADRVVVDDHLVRARRGGADLAADAHRLLGVPAEELGRVGDLALGVGHRLAVLAHDQFGELVGVLDEHLPAVAQDLAALAGRVLAHFTCAASAASHAATASAGVPSEISATCSSVAGSSTPIRPSVGPLPPLPTDQQLSTHAADCTPRPLPVSAPAPPRRCEPDTSRVMARTG